jgi:hypothetical protein
MLQYEIEKEKTEEQGQKVMTKKVKEYEKGEEKEEVNNEKEEQASS